MTENRKKALNAKLLVSAFVVGSAAYANQAMAFDMVYDPTNFVENLASATHSLAQEELQIQAAVRQVTMLENSVKNTENTISSLKGINSITSASQTISSLLSQWNTDETLMNELGGESTFISGVLSQYAASSSTGTLTDYIARLSAQQTIKQENATSLFANYQNMASELQKTITQRQTIAAKNTGALGTSDEIAITNAQLDNIAEINQATLQGIQTLVRQSAYNQTADLARTTNESTTRSTANTMGTAAAAGTSGISTATTLLGY
ncbi:MULTISPECIES: hypothetical protein [unclassified Paraburkholderia]|uniref:hypothetical protein n=1 Tax=unclassified Paraburkholderia TaxID=2615204 RepID=UPI002AAF73C5|nr:MULTISPECIES: hypothetical protein [unclassified Paraburkholderia]